MLLLEVALLGLGVGGIVVRGMAWIGAVLAESKDAIVDSLQKR